MNNLIPFTKTWKNKDGSYETKDYWLNPELPFEGMEACKVMLRGKEIECTKITYPGNFLTLIGAPAEFIAACRLANVASCILQDLYKENITIKQFMQQHERLNGVEV